MLTCLSNADYIFGDCETIIEGGLVGSVLRSMAYCWIGRAPDGDYRGLAIWAGEDRMRVAMNRSQVIELLKWRGWEHKIPAITPTKNRVIRFTD